MSQNPLAALKSKKEAFRKRQEEFDRPKAEWFKIRQGESLKIQFLQELSTEAENFNGSYGLSPVVLPQHDPDNPEDRYNIGCFLAVLEHTTHGPTGFLSRALDTMASEGKDYAEEMYRKNKEEDGWKAKENFYITVAVDRGKKEPSVEILSRGIHSEFVDEIVDFDSDSDGQGITGRTFLVKKGKTKNSPWMIKEIDEEMNVEGLVPYDLARDAVRHVPYAQQKEFYAQNYVPIAGSSAKDEDDDEYFDSNESAPISDADDDDEVDW